MIKAVRHTNIVVRNIEESVEFCRALGFVGDNLNMEEGNLIEIVEVL
jgi:catechol 2,3-dioxygenase-like lactoylglutathione lyase family enzyme